MVLCFKVLSICLRSLPNTLKLLWTIHKLALKSFSFLSLFKVKVRIKCIAMFRESSVLYILMCIILFLLSTIMWHEMYKQ